MTTTLLRSTTASDPYNNDYGRAVVTRATGVVYVAAYQSDDKIHIYEVSADRTTVNDRFSITPFSSQTPERISLGLSPTDNSLSLAYIVNPGSANNSIRWCKINTSTWAASTSWEAVTGGAGSSVSFDDFDLDVSDTGMPIIAAMIRSFNAGGIPNPAGVNVYCRNLGSSTWVHTGGINLYNAPGTVNYSGSCVSVIALGINSGVRDIVIAGGVSVGSVGQPVHVATLRATESSGAQTGSTIDRLTSFMTGTLTAPTTSKKRHVRLFRVSTTTYALGGMAIDTKTLHFHKGTFSVSTWTNNITEKIFNWSNKTWAGMGMTFGFAPGGAAITYVLKDSTGIPWVKANYTSSGAWVGGEGRYYSSDNVVNSISDASVPFPDITESDIFIGVKSGSNNQMYDANNLLPSGLTGITQLTPVEGAINQPASPPLSGLADTGLKYGTGIYEIEFQFALDSGFTTSVVSYRQPVANGIYIDGTDTAGVTVPFSDTLGATLPNGAWFYRARITDMWGNVGDWTATQTFAVGHPPAAILTAPAGGGFYNWSAGKPTFTWTFTDPSGGDFQTAYQLKIFDASNTSVLDTGKVTSSQKTFTPGTAFSSGLKDTQMSWQAKLWDSQDTEGFFSDLEPFILTDPPSVVIDEPDPDDEVTTGVPTYTFTATTGGSRRIVGYSILVTSGGDIVYSGPLVTVDVASGVPIDAVQPPNYLQNDGSYTVQVSVIDDAGLIGVSSFTQFTTNWPPPASVTDVQLDVSSFDLEGAGYNLVTWSDSARAAGFTHWTIYRRSDLIDEVGTVLETGDWEKVGDDFDISSGGSYAYRDYLAPANYLTTYAVTQWVNTDGQDIESDKSTSSSQVPASEAYWLVNIDQANNTATTFKMSIVTGDSFTEEHEEAEFTVIGRGRRVNRGQYLGPKGSLDARLRSTGLLTARQKRLQLLAIQELVGEMQMRNPFGDVWTVNMSNMQVSRLAGVGTSEFCDVSIPYSEVR